MATNKQAQANNEQIQTANKFLWTRYLNKVLVLNSIKFYKYIYQVLFPRKHSIIFTVYIYTPTSTNYWRPVWCIKLLRVKQLWSLHLISRKLYNCFHLNFGLSYWHSNLNKSKFKSISIETDSDKSTCVIHSMFVAEINNRKTFICILFLFRVFQIKKVFLQLVIQCANTYTTFSQM